jgi:glycosyltransferase involved in cell wall biosynthesis
MSNISVCLLTFNSMRTIERCLLPIFEVADEVIVIDSGSTDGTLQYLTDKGITADYRSYDTHASQMNYAIGLSNYDWVLCLDSDEFLDSKTIENIRHLKVSLIDESIAYRISRYWLILGHPIHSIYPVSSPDYPVRLFHKKVVAFNGQPVDDKPEGFMRTEVIEGCVIHDTFYSLNEIFGKLNSYTTRLILYKNIKPSLIRAFLSPIFAFFKWYFLKKGYKDGAYGIVSAMYAILYTFMKFFKSWCKSKNIPLV